jgi:hypothetical protein
VKCLLFQWWYSYCVCTFTDRCFFEVNISCLFWFSCTFALKVKVVILLMVDLIFGMLDNQFSDV